MRKKLYIVVLAISFGMLSCAKSDFEENYADPSKISSTSVEKQFTGFLSSNLGYVMPSYWDYFVVMRTTLTRYTQAVGWENGANQYIPAAAGASDRWSSYYGFLAQFRELEKVYNATSTDDQALRKIYMIAAKIYLYDHTQKVVDLHGDIPFSGAAMLSTNGGDYQKSFAPYDAASAIYTKMLDDLKTFANDLSTITVSPAIQTGFKTQDIVNKGDLNKWKIYCNSLRLRMLTRVSGSSALSARATSEIAEILGNPTKYPVASSNAANIKVDVYDLNTGINGSGFRSGLEDWNGNLAGKAMIDHMKTNSDPRLRAMFEPAVAGGGYVGLDPLAATATQTPLITAGAISIYNRSTLTRNQFFPGMLINAAEVSFLTAEYYLKAGNDAAAKTAYEKGIKESVNYYYWLRSISNDNTAIALVPTSDEEIAAYIAGKGIDWASATTSAAKLALIANQKWIHYSVIQLPESWAEIRRLDLPVLSFQVDNANAQKQPPYRWNYPTSEITYNTENYTKVKANDNLTTKLFWDVK